MSRPSPLARARVMWEVEIKAHTITGHTPGVEYEIPARKVVMGGSEFAAKAQALRWAHSDAKVPKWKPYMRQSWPHITATKQTTSVDS